MQIRRYNTLQGGLNIMELELTEKYNRIYKKGGFHAVIKQVENDLTYGRVIPREDNIYKIITCGWSGDEEIVYSLNHILSHFGHNHYIGMICGGAFYYTKDNVDTCGRFEIVPEKTEEPHMCRCQ